MLLGLLFARASAAPAIEEFGTAELGRAESLAARADATVDESSGAASIRIPIDVPPGPGGLAPDLALVYSSARRDGFLGVGWSLPLGRIRCADRFGVRPATGCTRFELDGELLVGPDDAGRFHTLVEGFAAIRRLADGSWEVTSPEGRIGRYGETVASRLAASDGGVDTWLLSSVEDPWQNRIRVEYASLGDRGQRYPIRIRYGLPGSRSIELVYGDRPDPRHDFRGGLERTATKRLVEIRILVNEDEARPYARWVLQYEDGTGGDHPTRVSRLASLQRFGSDCPLSVASPTTSCAGLPASRFTYAAAGGSGGTSAWVEAPEWTVPFQVTPGSYNEVRTWGVEAGDVDGDGLPDLIRDEHPLGLPYAETLATRPTVHLNTGAGFESPAWSSPQQQTGPLNRSAQWTEKLRALRVALPRIRSEVRDFDAGGYADPGTAGGTVDAVERTVEFSFRTVQRQPAVEYSEPEPGVVEASLRSAFQLYDIDADGRADLVMSVRLVGPAAFVDPANGALLPEAQQMPVGNVVARVVLWNTGELDPSDPGQNPWIPRPDLAEGMPPFSSSLVESAYYLYAAFVPGPDSFPPRSPWDDNGPCAPWGLAGARVAGHYAVWSPDWGEYACEMSLTFQKEFGDFDGDGYPDILVLEPDDSEALWVGDPGSFGMRPPRRTSSLRSTVWLQRPEAAPGEPRWERAPDFQIPFPHAWTILGTEDRGEGSAYASAAANTSDSWTYDVGVRFVDINRDGLEDVLWWDWNVPNPWYASTPREKGPSVYRGVLLNRGRGDGQPSSAWCSAEPFELLSGSAPPATPPVTPVVDVCPEAARYLPPIEFIRGPKYYYTNHVYFGDVNGDGWLDLVHHLPGAEARAFLHDPNAVNVWVETPRFRPPIASAEFTGVWETLGTLYLDANGDGITDVLSDGWNPWSPVAPVAHLAAGPIPDLLVELDNGRGGIVRLDYAGAAQQRRGEGGEGLLREAEAVAHAARAGIDEPFDPMGEPVRWTPEPVVVSIAIEGPAHLSPELTRYHYAHPRACPEHRTTLGFRHVTRRRADGSEVRSLHYQRHGRAGRLSEATTFAADGRPVHHAREVWALPDPASVVGAWAGDPASGREGSYVGWRVLEEAANQYGASVGELAGALRSVSYAYDGATAGYGFWTERVVTRPTGTLVTTRERAQDVAFGLRRLVASVVDVDDGGRRIAERRLAYVDEAGRSTRGSVALERRWVADRDDPSGSTSPATWVDVRFGYDAYGNRVSTHALGDPADPTDDRSTLFCYDGDPRAECGAGQGSHSLMAGVRDAHGIWRTLERHPVFPTLVGVSSGYVDEPTRLATLDAFGRVVDTFVVPRGGDESDALHTGRTVHVDAAAPSSLREVYTYTTAEADDWIHRRVYEDGFGGRWKQVEAVPGGRYRGTAVFRDPAAGRRVETWPVACRDGTGLPDPSCAGIAASAPGLTRELDALGRATALTTPEGVGRIRHAAGTSPLVPGVGLDAVLHMNAKGDLVETLVDGERRVVVRACGNALSPPVGDLTGVACTPGSALGDVAETLHAYEADGRIRTVWDAVATATGALDDPAHRIDYAYDTRGLVRRIDDPNAGWTTIAYDAFGSVASTADPRPGSTVTRTHDRLGRPRSISTVEGETTFAYRWNRMQPSWERGPGYAIRREYDPLGRLAWSSQSAADTLYEDYAYDLLGRVTEIGHPVEVDGVRSVLRYEYEGGYLERICDLGEASDCSAGGGARQHFLLDVRYDDVGRRVALELPGGERSYAWDAQTRRRTRDGFESAAGGGFAVHYLYRTGDTDESPGTPLYDPVGNLLEVRGTSTAGGPSLSERYAYDARNRLTRWTRPEAPAPPVEYAYDALGNLTSRGGVAQAYAATRPHAVESTADGARSFAYDAAGNLRTISDAAGTRHYAFDARGRLACIGTAAGACDVIGLLYDASGRRIQERVPGWIRSFFGDDFVWARSTADGARHAQIEVFAFGERIAFKRIDGGALLARHAPWALPLDRPITWIVSSLVLLVVLGATAARVGRGTRARTRGAQRVSLPGRARRGGRKRRAGRRRRARAAVVSVLLLALVQPRAALALAGGPPLPGAETDRWVLGNRIGTGLVVFDEAGLRTRQLVFDPFGAIVEESTLGPAAGRTWFAGHTLQAETGHVYMQARWYEPGIGRFLSPDPVVDLRAPQASNAYAYAMNDPVNRTDPTGAISCGPGCSYYGSYGVDTATGRKYFGGELHSARVGGANVVSVNGRPVGGAPGGSASGAKAASLGQATGVEPGAPRRGADVAPARTAQRATTTDGAESGGGSWLGRALGALGRILLGDLGEMVGGVVGTLYGIGKGLLQIGLGIATASPTTLVRGLGTLGSALVMPRSGSHSGLGWPGTRFNAPITWLTGTRLNGASRWHDGFTSSQGFGSDAQLGWIERAWTGSGTALGPYGQAYRLLGTVGFGLVSGVQRAVGH